MPALVRPGAILALLTIVAVLSFHCVRYLVGVCLELNPGSPPSGAECGTDATLCLCSQSSVGPGRDATPQACRQDQSVPTSLPICLCRSLLSYPAASRWPCCSSHVARCRSSPPGGSSSSRPPSCSSGNLQGCSAGWGLAKSAACMYLPTSIQEDLLAWAFSAESVWVCRLAAASLAPPFSMPGAAVPEEANFAELGGQGNLRFASSSSAPLRATQQRNNRYLPSVYIAGSPLCPSLPGLEHR